MNFHEATMKALKMVEDSLADKASWGVEVHFATAKYPRIVARFATEEEARREARAYTSDAIAVRVVSPCGKVVPGDGLAGA